MMVRDNLQNCYRRDLFDKLAYLSSFSITVLLWFYCLHEKNLPIKKELFVKDVFSLKKIRTSVLCTPGYSRLLFLGLQLSIVDRLNERNFRCTHLINIFRLTEGYIYGRICECSKLDFSEGLWIQCKTKFWWNKNWFKLIICVNKFSRKLDFGSVCENEFSRQNQFWCSRI